jgi:hypothetical protein
MARHGDGCGQGRKRHSIGRSIHRNPSFRNVRNLWQHARQEHLMLDIVMLALGLGFFVAGIGYAYACERL